MLEREVSEFGNYVRERVSAGLQQQCLLTYLHTYYFSYLYTFGYPRTFMLLSSERNFLYYIVL